MVKSENSYLVHATASLCGQEKEVSREELAGNKPLLLLYAINKGSQPATTNSKSRSNLEALSDILGFGVVFPGSSDSSGKYFSVDLDFVSGDEIEEIDAEELAQAEAANV